MAMEDNDDVTETKDKKSDRLEASSKKEERERDEDEDSEEDEESADDEREAAGDEDDEEDDDDAPSKNGRSKGKARGGDEVAPLRTGPAQAAGPVRNTLTIAKREFRAYFDSLVAYIVIGGSMLILGVYFFMMSGSFWQIERATMGRMFEFLPWALSMGVIPLITMRSLAEEKRSGTIELLITMPVRDSDVIMGKYLAALGMAVVLLLCTVLYPVAMFVWPWHLGALDWGPVWTGYLGLVLFLMSGIAVGMFFSSITESQIIAFFVTAAVLLGLHVIGNVVESLPGVVGDSIAFVSFQTRFAPFARGLIDTRAVVYFLSITVLCLIAAFRSLESRKWK
jgi:ABC-2 type transport system permease protein